MRLNTPRWWYVRPGEGGRETARLTRALLKPLSWLWADRTARRIAGTTPNDVGVPIISVGNLTVGGSGKTPVTQAILARLRERGVAAAALSRGYGGRLAGPLQVDPARHGAAEVGDEPLMLAADGPAWIARDRVDGARAAVAVGAEALVLDDGHQNPALKKTLSLIVVDGETRNGEWPFGDGSVFPSGPMREPLAAGLARADAVVLLMPGDAEKPDNDLLALLGGLPVLVARLEPTGTLPSGALYGFAGIAKPWKVERALKAAGANLVDFAAFPDHGTYGEGDLTALMRQAEAHGARLITTEKDWVRLPPDWRPRIAAWPVRVRFEDPVALDVLLDRARL